MKAPHRNRFFLVATPHGASTALCQNEYANVENALIVSSETCKEV